MMGGSGLSNDLGRLGSNISVNATGSMDASRWSNKVSKMFSFIGKGAEAE